MILKYEWNTIAYQLTIIHRHCEQTTPTHRRLFLKKHGHDFEV